MTVERLLNNIGKAVFVKYYYNFRDKSRDYCITHIVENFTEKAKSSRTGHAQAIFKVNNEREALMNIVSSKRLSEDIREEAKRILTIEFGVEI